MYFSLTKLNDAFTEHVSDLALKGNILEFSCVDMFHVLIFVLKSLHAPFAQWFTIKQQEGQEEPEGDFRF